MPDADRDGVGGDCRGEECLAAKLTGMTRAEAEEYDFGGVWSVDEVFREDRVPVRQNVRLGAGLVVGMGDREADRRVLAAAIPASLKP